MLRILKILIFPIIAPLLLIGYALYILGESKHTVKKEKEHEPQP